MCIAYRVRELDSSAVRALPLGDYLSCGVHRQQLHDDGEWADDSNVNWDALSVVATSGTLGRF